MEVKLSSQNFESVVLGSDIPVLIDFGAEWCTHCKRLAPIISQIANERDDVLVCTVNTDEESELAEAFGVEGIPALFVIKNGEISNQSVGYRSKAEILKLIDEN